MVLTRWLDWRGRECAGALRWAFLNACFAAGARTLLDDAIVAAGGRRAGRGWAAGWRAGGLAGGRAGCWVAGWLAALLPVPLMAQHEPGAPLLRLPCVPEAPSPWPSCWRVAGREAGLGGVAAAHAKLDELPFDFVRRRASVLLQARSPAVRTRARGRQCARAASNTAGVLGCSCRQPCRGPAARQSAPPAAPPCLPARPPARTPPAAHQEPGAGAPLLVCKGAVEEMAALCAEVEADGGQRLPLDDRSALPWG